MDSDKYYRKVKQELRSIRKRVNASLVLLVDKAGILIARDAEKQYEIRSVGALVASWLKVQDTLSQILQTGRFSDIFALAGNGAMVFRRVTEDVMVIVILKDAQRESALKDVELEDHIHKLRNIITDVKDTLYNQTGGGRPVIDSDFITQLERAIDTIFQNNQS
jgi:predicted regulator of Ras-like GTPase activity (Roadblock/LC7/MglB family)